MKPCKSADYSIKVSFHIVVYIRQGESNIFQISTWKAFLSLKIYLLWKIRSISVKGWKPVWIRACPIVLLVNLQQLAIVRLKRLASDCERRTSFIMNILNFPRWKSKSWKTTLWDSNDSNKTGMGFALSPDLFYFGFFIAAGEFLGFGRCLYRGTQRQVLENICSEDDLRSRFSEHLLLNFLLACLS